MSQFKSSATSSRADAGSHDPSPKRKVSMDLMRLKNFPSTLSLRKPDPDTPPRADGMTSSSTFSRLRNFGQSSRQSRASTGADQADTSTDSKSSSTKRTSRLLDAFKPTKKQTPSFEVVRKPPNRSTTSFHSSSHQPSPSVEVPRPASRLSVHKAPEVARPAPRISFSEPRSPVTSSHPQSSSTAAASSTPDQDDPKARLAYPPSTSRTRKFSGNHLSASSSRKPSDPYLNPASASNSRAQSPSTTPTVENPNGSFSLHSFRNVRSPSEASAADDPSTQSHSRVHSMISVDEYVTPGEELPEPRYITDAEVGRTASPIPNARPASISAAKFRQAARQRSESGTIPTLDTLQGGPGFVRPQRSRTPSQDLAAMEAALAQTHPNAYRTSVAEKRRSGDPATLSAAASSPSIADDSQRRKRGFFIVVEGLDRAGKSTQVERLAEHLQAKAIKFPERTTAIGIMINSYLAQTSDLDDQAIHLLFSANRWECVSSIKKTLEAGESIVCDRYAFSGIAYSVAKGLSYDWCRNPDVGLPLPDLTMFLDLDAQTAAARGGYGEERYEKLEFQAKVRDAFSRVSQDVKAHGGRWVTIDASKTLDQVTDDIQRAVLRATSSIDRVGAKLGRLFVSERPANVRAGSSSEMYPSMAVPNTKRSSMSSEDFGRRGKSLDQPRININTATTNGNFPANRPTGSPLTYTDQLAAVRAAAAGTLSGLFGGSNVTVDQRSPSIKSENRQPDLDGPSPVNSARGQGYDSARVLANANLREGSGRRRTLIDVIGEIENQPQQATRADHRRSLSAAAETTTPTNEGFPSTFAQAGRARRSTEQGRLSALPTIESSGARPVVAPRSASLTVQPGAGDVAPTAIPTYPTNSDRPLASPLSPRSPASPPNGFASGPDVPRGLSPAAVRPSTLSPAPRTSSTALSNSSRSSLASPPPRALSTPPILRPASTNPADIAHGDASASGGNIDPNLLSSQHLSMLAMQQNQAEMQEQYMRNYMAMMANPALAQQAHYQLMLQRHQQQYFGRAASAIGPTLSGGNNLGAGANGNGVPPVPTQVSNGPPLAAFMQPAQGVGVQPLENGKGPQKERTRSHKRSLSGGPLYDTPSNGLAATSNGAAPTSTSQPMLSMMMAAPPPIVTSHPSSSGAAAAFAPQAYYAAPHPQMYGGQPMFYPPMMAGGAWGQQPTMTAAAAAAFAGGARPGYAQSRSEIGVPGGLRSQRSSDAALRSQYLKQPSQPK
ncbi:Thymidylate kinase, conserved site [Kalmanozyma brasiliensis GHG001]|uniref:Thymidylate kinase, conserved site n=1 Tax=Kalmanozyma brasiliensis (strain GHG001) TaxID=1365824 RepID=UPI002867E831|nr:Thymidylate kinase, conserved site [Kalmanozyma brasiliensis GHG001]EST05046.2 Thymidylate kinase, conserved site [Kalmanozyma brasiliensis GHG001]